MIRCKKCCLPLTLQRNEEVMRHKILSEVCFGLSKFCKEMKKKYPELKENFEDYERKFLAFSRLFKHLRYVTITCKFCGEKNTVQVPKYLIKKAFSGVIEE